MLLDKLLILAGACAERFCEKLQGGADRQESHPGAGMTKLYNQQLLKNKADKRWLLHGSAEQEYKLLQAAALQPMETLNHPLSRGKVRLCQ